MGLSSRKNGDGSHASLEIKSRKHGDGSGRMGKQGDSHVNEIQMSNNGEEKRGRRERGDTNKERKGREQKFFTFGAKYDRMTA
jgi:hypothetical protein